MLSFKPLLFSSLFILLVIFIQMTASTPKTCWPELVGKTADEAVELIKQESGKRIV